MSNQTNIDELEAFFRAHRGPRYVEFVRQFSDIDIDALNAEEVNTLFKLLLSSLETQPCSKPAA